MYLTRRYNFLDRELLLSQATMAFATSGRSDGIARTSIMEEAGQKLKRVRERLNLRFREVEEASGKIAAAHKNDEYAVAISRLADIENKGTLPTIYRLYSLSAIYALDLLDVLSWYGISISQLSEDSKAMEHPNTHPINFHTFADGQVQVPLTLDPGLDLTQTVFLSRMIQKWGKLPLMLLNRIDLKGLRYGLIGTEDWSMYPLIAPGSLVVIDDTRRRIANSGWSTEFERPIYFLEHRNGYACGWCTLRDKQLTVHPHPSSLSDPQAYVYQEEIEVIGQVTQVAMTLDPAFRRRPRS
jgi:transcriptional regulator with XRE-family HTH domain